MGENGRGGGEGGEKQSETGNSFPYRANLRQIIEETVDTPTTKIKNQIERKLTTNNANDDDDDDDNNGVIVEDDDVVKVKEQKKTDDDDDDNNGVVVEDDDVVKVKEVEIKQNKEKNDDFGIARKKKKMIIQ